MFILPGFREVVAAIKDAGAYCIKHTDGDISSIIDMLVDSGIDALGPLEPGAGMDLVRLKKTHGDKIAFVGNVDVDLLSRGSVEEVTNTTRQLVEQAAPGGGYILSSGNSITSSVQPKNYLAMLSAAKAYDKKKCNDE
jgi:uroporphyrinogen decarboxylase